MATRTPTHRTKITAKVYTPLLRLFNQQTDELYLARDAFLDAMISNEAPRLAEDLNGKRQSSAARLHVARSLKRLGTQQVNIVVRKQTADTLNKAVADHNLVRDAFINRLILFLRGSEFLLNYLELPKVVVSSAFEHGIEAMPTSPLKAIEAIHTDPLYYLRAAIEERHQTSLYLVEMPPQLLGFSCFLDDAQVPGTPDHAEAQRLAEELLSELDTFERDAFSAPEKKGESK